MILPDIVDFQSCFLCKRLKCLATKFIINQAAKRDGVSHELLPGDGIPEEQHRRRYQKNVLQNTRHGKNDGRRLTNLSIY